mmetsp:Transcript_1964/g.3937  ORF Transcript_1964/g.3937 Transcript_1964/m.3937 type:complete len:224 (+) Transcript_1964:164-835(+)
MSSCATGSCDSVATLAASGAEKFARFKSSEFSKSVRIHAADEARRFYEQARRMCYDPKMRTVLAKNQATVCFRLVELRGYTETVALEGVIYTARDAANLLSEALYLACNDGEIATLERVRFDMETIAAGNASKVAKAFNLAKHICENLQGKNETSVATFTTAVENLPARSSDDFNKMLRKAFLKAAMVYHPDKNDDHGLEWKVLCEEVSKRINNATCGLKGLC